MSRRKTIFYGRSLNERLKTCLSFPEYERAGELLGEIDFELNTTAGQSPAHTGEALRHLQKRAHGTG